MIQSLSTRLATKIKDTVPEHPSSVAVLSYGISFLINTFSIILGTLLVAQLTGHVGGAIMAMAGFAVLRQISGGIHLKSGLLCIATSICLMTLISMTSLSSVWTTILTLAAAGLALAYAPSRIEKQSKIPKSLYPACKAASVIFILANLTFNEPVLAMAFFVQALTLVRLKGGEEA